MFRISQYQLHRTDLNDTTYNYPYVTSSPFHQLGTSADNFLTGDTLNLATAKNIINEYTDKTDAAHYTNITAQMVSNYNTLKMTSLQMS